MTVVSRSDSPKYRYRQRHWYFFDCNAKYPYLLFMKYVTAAIDALLYPMLSMNTAV